MVTTIPSIIWRIVSNRVRLFIGHWISKFGMWTLAPIMEEVYVSNIRIIFLNCGASTEISLFFFFLIRFEGEILSELFNRVNPFNFQTQDTKASPKTNQDKDMTIS